MNDNEKAVGKIKIATFTKDDNEDGSLNSTKQITAVVVVAIVAPVPAPPILTRLTKRIGCRLAGHFWQDMYLVEQLIGSREF